MNRLSKKLQSAWSLKKPLYLDKKDKRYPRHLKQLKSNGFSDSETWGLYEVIIDFILPRLIRFKEVNNGYPAGMTQEEWDNIIDKMIFSFQWFKDDDKFLHTTMNVDERAAGERKYEEGIDLFAKYFRYLWW